jgi:spore germination protein GerM
VFDELTAVALRTAVAQIVATASEIDGIEQVRIQIDGENQVWPVGDGENTGRPLTVYDYPGFIESSQPAYPAIPRANN